MQGLNLARKRMICVCGAGGKTSLIFALAREFAAMGENVLITATTRLGRHECQGRFRVAKAQGAGALVALASTLFPGGDVVIACSGPDPGGEKLVGFPPETLDAVFRAGVFDRILVEADGSRRKPLKAPGDHEPVFCETADGVVVVAGMNGVGRELTDEALFRADRWSAITGLRRGDRITPASVAAMIAHADGSARGCPAQTPISVFLNRADSDAGARNARDILRLLALHEGGRRLHAVAGWLHPAPGILVPAGNCATR